MPPGTDRLPPYAIVWDLDGTLVDTGELHYAAWRRLAEKHALPFTRDDFTSTFGWRNTEIIPHLFGVTDEAGVARMGAWKEASYREQALLGVALLPGVAELLASAGAAGFLQAIGSSAPRSNIELLIDITHTRTYFGAMVSMEDTTRGKPDPEVFLLAADRLGVPPGACCVIEDAPAGIRAAKTGGMVAIGVTVAGHHPTAELYAAGADLVVTTLEGVDAGTVATLIDTRRESTG